MDISYIKHVFAYFGWNNDFLNSKNVTAICIEESADEETKEQFKDIPNEAASIFGASDHIPCVLQLLMDYVGMDPNGIIDNDVLNTRPPVHKPQLQMVRVQGHWSTTCITHTMYHSLIKWTTNQNSPAAHLAFLNGTHWCW